MTTEVSGTTAGPMHEIIEALGIGEGKTGSLERIFTLFILSGQQKNEERIARGEVPSNQIIGLPLGEVAAAASILIAAEQRGNPLSLVVDVMGDGMAFRVLSETEIAEENRRKAAAPTDVVAKEAPAPTDEMIVGIGDPALASHPCAKKNRDSWPTPANDSPIDPQEGPAEGSDA